MTSEILVYGYIQVPYPYLEPFQETLTSEKGRSDMKDYPDFISQANACRGNAIFSFCYSFVYEKDFNYILLEKFISFLKKVQFLTASLNLNLDEKEYEFYQFFSDGKDLFKFKHEVITSEIEMKI